MRSSSKPAVYSDTEDLTHAIRWAPHDLAEASEPTVLNEVEQANAINLQQQAALESVEQLRIEQEERVREAHATGYEEGHLDGELAEGLRLRQAVAVAELALDTIRTNEAKWQECVTENVTSLAIAVARHIVGREISTDASVIADLVKRALVEFPIDQAMRIRVHPLDLSMLSTYTTPEGEPLAIAPNRDVRWLADARIQPGGCIVEGRERIIDGRIDTALERVYRQLTHTDA